jgi:hypothetical protein
MSKPQTDLGLAFPILRLAELAAYALANVLAIAPCYAATGVLTGDGAIGSSVGVGLHGFSSG